MFLAAIIVNPSITIGDYKIEYIVLFLPVLEQEMIRKIVKIFLKHGEVRKLSPTRGGQLSANRMKLQIKEIN